MLLKIAIVLYGSVHQHRILSFIFLHKDSGKDFHVNNYRIFKRSDPANVTLDFKTFASVDISDHMGTPKHFQVIVWSLKTKKMAKLNCCGDIPDCGMQQK